MSLLEAPAAQGTLSLLVGAYYAGLYGLTAPELNIVSHALLGLLVLFHLRMTNMPSADNKLYLYVLCALLVLWGSWAGLTFGVSSKKRNLTDILDTCTTDQCQQIEHLLTEMGGDTDYWSKAPHDKERRQGLTVLTVIMTIILGSYLIPDFSAQPSSSSSSNTVPGMPWLVAVVLVAWVGWVHWAMGVLSSYTVVQHGKRDMVYPQIDGGGPGLSSVTPLVTKMQLYATVGVVAVAAVALAPHHPAVPLLCFLYLFMGMYFLSNLYQINRMVVALESMGQSAANPQPVVVPRYKLGLGVLGGSAAAALLALYGKKPHWPAVLLVVVSLGFAAWDTHATERVQDVLT